MANLRVRIDDELKDESAKILEELGLDLSTGIRIFLKQVVTERAIPFKNNFDAFANQSSLR